LSIDLNID